MKKRRNRIYRKIAVALTVALLAGQSHVVVLAEEPIALEEEMPDEEIQGTAGNEESEADDVEQEDGDGTETDDKKDDDDTEVRCVCEVRCAAERINADCLVCAADYAACNGEEIQTDLPEPEESVSENDLEPEESVSENDLEENAGIALLSENDGAETYEIGDTFKAYLVIFEVTGDDEVAIVGWQKDATPRGEIRIPEVVKTAKASYRVTSVGDSAFSGISASMAGVLQIPDSVTSIGAHAFSHCRANTLNIPDSVTSIGEYAYEYCSGLTKEPIPESVTSIGKGAFYGSSLLYDVKIPKSITTIEEGTFMYCNFTEIEIPEGVTSIGTQAFARCEYLKDVEIPNTVTSIGYGAFSHCFKLQSVKLPNQLPKLENNIFGQCKALTSIEIPESVTSIGDYAFDSAGLTAVTAWGSVTEIGHGAFSSCPFVSITISDGVTSIGTDAFSYCRWLKSVKIPDSVTSVSQSAFRACYELQSVEISSAVTEIEPLVFYQCAALTDVKIPNSVKSIGREAFGVCQSLSSITIPDSVRNIGSSAFSGCKQLEVMNIVISSEGQYQFPEVDDYGFATLPDARYIRFIDENGNELTGQAYDDAFVEAAKNDGDSDDSTWYGWYYREAPEVTDTYKVVVAVQKDDQPWGDHGRTFALSKDDGATFVTDLTAVEAVEEPYAVYDVSGLTADEFQEKGVNTGVTVTVANEDVTATVNYYTVTFYDGTDSYGEDTSQKPQIVLSGQGVAKPDDPVKTDWQFAGWKTEDKGSTPYDFSAAVTGRTDIFASWIEKTAEQFHITATAAEGGTIDPKGDIAVTKGGEQTFIITPDEGKRIKAVTVDDRDVTAELADTLARAQAEVKYYTFTNVNESHTIHAAFENDESKPGEEDKPGGEKPRPGENGGGSNSEPGDGADPDAGGVEPINVTVLSEISLSSTESATARQTAGEAERKSNEKEPKTGDSTHVEIYATVAMIAGLTYLLLYFMEEGRGMTEREKEVFVAAFIRWAKKGGAFRRGCAVVAIFCLLAYYHGIGKRIGRNAVGGRCLEQIS